MHGNDSRYRIAARVRRAQRDQQRREFALAAGVILLGVLLITGWGLGWFVAEISLESSDGHWADRERLAEGQDYTDSVLLFMQYRIDCDAPDVVVYRTTSMPWWNPFVWPSLLTEKKWSIPYRDARAAAPPTGIPDIRCAPLPDTWERAERQARRYLDGL